jgi:large subunit ribosomal protein LX
MDMEFTVNGTITLGKEQRSFSKTVDAPSENAARERIYAHFGSVNGVKRVMVKIEKVEKV